MDKLIRDSSTEIGAHSEIMLPLQLTLLLVSQILAKVQGDLQTEKGNFTNLSSPPDFGSNCTATCVVLCPEGWEKFEGHCYLWSDDKKNWLEAEETCQNHGGHLASVTDRKIYDFVVQKGVRVWIGGTDKDVEGKWAWTDCSAWDYDSGWRLDQTNQDEKEDCLELYYKVY